VNCEYAIDSVLYYLQNNLSTMLTTIRQESSSSLISPNPESFDFGEKHPSAISIFPAVMCKAVTTNSKDNQYQHQERTANLETIFWIVDVDENELHRNVVRYGESITRILRNESNWKVNLYNPKVGVCQYSDTYEVNFGLAQGGAVRIDIDYIIS